MTVPKESNLHLDENALAEVAKTNPEAMGKLFLAYYKIVYGYFINRTSDLNLSQDLTSQTFLKVIQHLHTYQARNDTPFSSWIIAVARNVLINYYRDQSKHSRHSAPYNSTTINLFPSPGLDPESVLIQKESIEENTRHLGNALSQIKFEYLKLLALRFEAGLTHPEIAAALGITEGASKTKLLRALRSLRNSLINLKANL